MTDWRTIIICPGCGKVYRNRKRRLIECKGCGYESDTELGICNLSQMLDNTDTWNDVALGKFLRSLVKVNKDE